MRAWFEPARRDRVARRGDRGGVGVGGPHALGDGGGLVEPAQATIEARDHRERVDLAAIVVEQRQQIDRGLPVVVFAEQEEQLLGDVERLGGAIERAAHLLDRLVELALLAQRARELEPRVDVVRVALDRRAQLGDLPLRIAAGEALRELVVAVDRIRDVLDQHAEHALGDIGRLRASSIFASPR